MLVREFIHDSLYNVSLESEGALRLPLVLTPDQKPHYGYFSKNVDIFTPEDAEGYKFKSISDQAMFQELMGERYETEYATPQDGLGRQVWHTPTELFKPYYARALTSAIVSQYKRNHFPHQDLLIYEVGAGNGSFMFDAMRFIRDEYPEIFARTKYRIVEISSALSHIQRKRAHDAGFTNVEVINQDFFKWKGGTTDPCFVVALEVFDNLSHDLVRYDMKTLEPKQAVVSINKEGDFSLEYETVTDPLLRRALEYRRLLPLAPNTQPPLSKAMLSSPALRNLYVNLPFAPNLSPPEFVPTKAVSFLERLRDQLPAHRLLMADFSELPEAVEGRNGPVVQTRYRNQMVPCSTFLVKQGYFDIFFPTDFELLRDVYGLIMNSPARRVTPPGANGSSGEAEAATVDEEAAAAASSSSSAASDPNPTPPTSIKGARAQKALDDDFFSPSGVRGFRRRHVGVYTQAEFIVKYGGEAMVGPTRMKDGLSPMLTMYDNAKIMF